MTIRVYQPRRFDLVGEPIPVAGVGTGFEATLNYRVHEGHDEVTGFFNVGGGTGEHDQFQLQIAVAGAAFQLARVFVEVFESSPKDGSERNKVTVPVIRGEHIVDGYVGFRRHRVEAGDTLWAIAEEHYGDGSLHPRLVTANQHVIDDPDLIFPGQVLRVPIGG